MTVSNKGRIFLDVDGVVLDSIGAVLKCFSIIEGIDYTKSQVKKWNFNDAIPHAKEIDIENIFASDLFWREVKFIDGAKDFINEHNDRVVFCSIGDARNQIRKIQFLNKHFPNVAMLPVITKVNKDRIIGKHLIRMTENDCFIDDSSSNINESMAGLKILFDDKGSWDCEWNSSCIVKCAKLSRWSEINKIIKNNGENIE